MARAKFHVPHHARYANTDIMGVESPCIKICELDKKTGFCVGCLRTKKECKD